MSPVFVHRTVVPGVPSARLKRWLSQVWPSRLHRVVSWLLGTAALSVAITGCSMFGPETALRQQMRELHGCPEEEVKISSLGGSRYQVVGCGSTEVFVCGQTDGWVCNR